MKQDSIGFILTAEQVVNNETVKIVANVVAMVLPALTEPKLKESLRELMRNFIPVADWQFAGMTRSSHASGLEQVTLSASARVPESENYALDRRREAASTDGLRINSTSTDTSPSKTQMDATYSSLRLELISMAQTEMTAINAALGGGYRISKLNFDPLSDMQPTKRNMMMSGATSYGSGFASEVAGGGGDIGNAVKVSMQAEVVLRRTAL